MEWGGAAFPFARTTSERSRWRSEHPGVSILFALVTSLCAVVVAILFITMWLDGDSVATTALVVALFPVLVLTMLAWGEAL